MGTLKNIRKLALRPGKTIPIVMDMYPGSPVLHVEHIGSTNFGWMNDNYRETDAVHIRGDKSLQTVEEAEIAHNATMLKAREKLIKHSVRSIEGWTYDPEPGEEVGVLIPSTPQGIRDVVFALPDDMIETVITIAVNANNYRDKPVSTPADIAKK